MNIGMKSTSCVILYFDLHLSCKFQARRNLIHHLYKATSLPRIIKKVLHLRIKLWRLFYTTICSYFYLSEHFDYPLLPDVQRYWDCVHLISDRLMFCCFLPLFHLLGIITSMRTFTSYLHISNTDN